MKKATKEQKRSRRHMRSRIRMHGTLVCPRMSVFRSLRGMYAQLVNDDTSTTLLSVSMPKKADTSVEAGERKGKVAAAYRLGLSLAQKAKEQKIERVVFDRGGNAYHGRVQAIADGARDGGLQF